MYDSGYLKAFLKWSKDERFFFPESKIFAHNNWVCDKIDLLIDFSIELFSIKIADVYSFHFAISDKVAFSMVRPGCTVTFVVGVFVLRIFVSSDNCLTNIQSSEMGIFSFGNRKRILLAL